MGDRKWYVSVLVLFSILLLAPAATGMQSAFADGNGSPEECKTDINLDSDDPGQTGDKISTILTDEIVIGVCIKSGNASFTGTPEDVDITNGCEGKKCKGQHSVELTEDGPYGIDGCYEVTGLGTTEVTISKTRDDKTCKDLSHVDVISEPGECITDDQCNDSNVCNGAETCDTQTLSCQSGTPLVCDDSNVCNGAETCDATNGCDVGTPQTCDDNETCDPTNGCQPILPPTEICTDIIIDFESYNAGYDLELPGAIHPDLDIQSPDSYDTKVIEENAAGTPLSTAYNTNGAINNGCLDDAKGMGPWNYYTYPELKDATDRVSLDFTFNGKTTDSFSIDVFDYGDFNPFGDINGEEDMVLQMNGYDASNVLIAQDIFSPTKSSIYDACDNGGDGKQTLQVSEPGISRVEIRAISGPDPGVGYDNLKFTICEDTTLPPVEICEDLDIISFEGHNELDELGAVTTATNTVTFKIDDSTDTDLSLLPGGIIVTGDDGTKFGFSGTGTGNGNVEDQVPCQAVVNDFNSLSNNIQTIDTMLPNTDFKEDWDVYDYVLLFDEPVTNLSLDVYDWADWPSQSSVGTLTLEVFSSSLVQDANTLVGTATFENTVGTPQGGADSCLTLSVQDPDGGTILSARVSSTIGDSGTAIDNITFCGDTAIEPAALGEIGDTVYEDTNDNGIQDNPIDEPGIPGVTVTLDCDSGAYTDSQETDANGNYLFTGVPAGLDCTVAVDVADVDIPSELEAGECPDTFVNVTLDAPSDLSFLDADFCFTPTFSEPPPVDCFECEKSTEFTVRYDSTDDPTPVDWSVNDKKGTGPSGTVSPGGLITIYASDFAKNKLESNTVYTFDNGQEVAIHTSCSQDLFIDQPWSSGFTTLTVVSGLDVDNNPSIPPLVCADSTSDQKQEDKKSKDKKPKKDKKSKK